MKSIVSLMLFCAVVLFSCSDRDDNLEGVQIRVQNSTASTFTEVVIDSLVFSNLESEEIGYYQKYDGLFLPKSVMLKTDSLEFQVAIDTLFAIDSTTLNLFTYRIKGMPEGAAPEVQVLKD